MFEYLLNVEYLLVCLFFPHYVFLFYYSIVFAY